MKKIVESSLTWYIVATIILIGNIAFYKWDYPSSGAQAAWDVHPLFWFMWQTIFAYAIIGITYLGIKKK